MTNACTGVADPAGIKWSIASGGPVMLIVMGNDDEGEDAVMRIFLGILLIVLGVAAAGLCLTLHVQFNTVATQSGAPNLDDYPLLEMFVPAPAPSATPADPAELAQTIVFRINAVGALGLVLVITGIVVCVAGRRGRPRHDDSAIRGGQESK